METEIFTGRGIGVPNTAFFIVGEIAGSGVLALPKAIDDSGWIGLFLLLACALLSSYTGAILGKTWSLVQERFPEYKEHCPNPYPVLGDKAFGKWGRYIVSFSINFTLFGVGTVFLLLAAENIEDLIENSTNHDISFCYWLLILAAVLFPLTWFGSPADFWPVAVGATSATALACILVIINIGIDSKDNEDPVLHSKTEFTQFFTAFGTIVFAFGGHPAFPTFQTDMRNPGNFKWAVLLGYIVVFLMYLPVSLSGYLVYGKNVKPNILLTVSKGGLSYSVEVLITLHLILGFIIVINPFCQELESYAKVPPRFGPRRMIFRTLVVGLVLFVAETIPHFGAILSLVGGSTVTLLAYVCPSLFYLKLSSIQEGQMSVLKNEENNENPKTPVPLWVKVLNIEIILVGIIAGIASTYAAITDIASPGSFTVPCYINITAASK